MNAQQVKQARLLIVDDTAEHLDILGSALSEYQRVFALNGEKALELAQSDPKPDLILLDVIMPDMDGFEVCRRLKQETATKDIPVIFITAKQDVADETHGLGIGAVDYITKPISTPRVQARVKTHLELKRARENLEKQNEILRENARLRDDVERITRHDLKSPLTCMISVPALMRMEENLNQEQLKCLDLVEEAGYQMLKMINLSLDLYKMETGKYRLYPKPLDLMRNIVKIKSETRCWVSSIQLALKVRVNGSPADNMTEFMVSGEELLLYSMLSNIIRNAIEAAPSGDFITITLDHGDQDDTITVHNKGVVPEEMRDVFFEKYTTSGKLGGTGLGTYSARLITHTHGGDIAMRTSDQAGTIISIRLPRAAN